MSIKNSKRNAIIVSITVIGLLAAGGGAYVYKHHGRAHSGSSAKPLSVVPAPAGLIGGTSLNLGGDILTLVNLNGRANLQLIKTSGQGTTTIVPVSSAATSVAANVNNVVALGLNTGTGGAVQFFSTEGFKSLSTVSVSGPVLALANTGGADFYALVQVGQVMSVAIIDSQSHRIIASIPMPSRTNSVAVSPDNTSVYALQGSGVVSVISISTSKVFQTFAVTPGARQLAFSPDGSRLYVLKGAGGVNNIAVVNLATQSTVQVLPAPAYCQAIVVGNNGNLYDLVGSPQFGNIQVYAAP